MKKGTISTQELIGIKGFSRNGIQTDGYGELVYFMVTPTNISVLSRVSIGLKIHHLMQFLSAQPDLEIICTDARENFDDNKLYLDERIGNEQNKKVRELLMRDKSFLEIFSFRCQRLVSFCLRFDSETSLTSSPSVANLFPFNYSGKTDPHGFYIGKDRYGTNILVDFDRRADDKTNSNILILGNSGQGNAIQCLISVVTLVGLITRQNTSSTIQCSTTPMKRRLFSSHTDFPRREWQAEFSCLPTAVL